MGTEQLGPDMAAATSPDPPDGSPTPHASPTEELEMELEGDNVRMPVVIMLCAAYPWGGTFALRGLADMVTTTRCQQLQFADGDSAIDIQ